MENESDLRKFQCVYESLEIPGMIDESVFYVGFVRLAHADKVKRDRSSMRLEVGNHVTPQVARSRIAVKEENRITCAFFDIMQFGAVHFNESRFKRE